MPYSSEEVVDLVREVLIHDPPASTHDALKKIAERVGVELDERFTMAHEREEDEEDEKHEHHKPVKHPPKASDESDESER